MMLRKVTYLIFLCCLVGLSYHFADAAPTYITNLSNFPAYPYNTGAYSDLTTYVGCGPTTGAMILGYFQNEYGAANLLTPPTPATVDQGLQTAWRLHSSTYMQTGPDGFGSQYRIEPGMENYASDRGYDIDVLFHVSPTYTSPNANWDAYGPYPTTWVNDGNFWVETSPGVWDIDDAAFFTFTSAKLAAGIPIFLTIDYDSLEGGDHWVPMIGVELINNAATYYFYNTFDTDIHSGSVNYAPRTTGGGDLALTFLRTVTYVGEQPIPEPSTLFLLGAGLAGVWLLRRRIKN